MVPGAIFGAQTNFFPKIGTAKVENFELKHYKMDIERLARTIFPDQQKHRLSV